MAAHEDIALVKVQHADHGADGGGLPRPVRADEADDGTRLHAQGKVAHRALAALIRLGKVFYLQHCFPSLRVDIIIPPPEKNQ